MEILNNGVQSITLESYSIEREASGQPVTIRAELQISTPTMTPETMRIRVKFQQDFVFRNEADLGQKLLELLKIRF
jgi:hypothetical protein